MSDVPMTRPQEALVVHQAEENAPSTFVELEDGRVLGAKYDGRVLGAKYDRESSLFTVSDDGGISWSEPVELGDKSGGPVQAFGASQSLRQCRWGVWRDRDGWPTILTSSSGAQRMAVRPGSRRWR